MISRAIRKVIACKNPPCSVTGSLQRVYGFESVSGRKSIWNDGFFEYSEATDVVHVLRLDKLWIDTLQVVLPHVFEREQRVNVK